MEQNRVPAVQEVVEVEVVRARNLIKADQVHIIIISMKIKVVIIIRQYLVEKATHMWC